MTTINNSENLIEIVGGIEKAREIAFDPLHPQMTHVSNDGRHWVNEAFAHIPEIQCQIESMIRIEDLRTAIAENDSREFKVGDLVVIKANPFWPEDYFIQQVEPENIGKWYMNAWRHATPEEIKAGHRIDDTTDHVTDIRNHVSLNTKVIDHGKV